MSEENQSKQEVPIAGIGTMVFGKWDATDVTCSDPEDEEEGDIIKEEEEKLKCILCKTVFDTKEEQIAHECSTKPPSEELR